MEWRHNGSTRPKKIPSAKISRKSSSLDFLDQECILLIDLSFKGPNYQRGVLLISAGAIEGHFEGKTPREVHQGGLVLARQRPGSRDTLQPRRNWPTCVSNVLITHPTLRIWPR